MDLRQHHGLLEGLEQRLPVHLVLPEVSQPRRAVLVGRLGVAHAPVVDWLELPEVAHEDDGDVAEGETVGIEARLAEEPSPPLLEAEMHAREEAAADEGHLVDDEEHHVGPGPLEALRCFAL